MTVRLQKLILQLDGLVFGCNRPSNNFAVNLFDDLLVILAPLCSDFRPALFCLVSFNFHAECRSDPTRFCLFNRCSDTSNGSGARRCCNRFTSHPDGTSLRWWCRRVSRIQWRAMRFVWQEPFKNVSNFLLGRRSRCSIVIMARIFSKHLKDLLHGRGPTSRR